MENLFPLESCWFVVVIAAALAVFMLWWLARSLPMQNLLMGVPIIMAANALLDWYLARYGWIDVETSLSHYVAGASVLWLAMVLSCRRLAQFIIEPWRRERLYGLWVIIIGSIFTGMFQFGWPSINPDPVKESSAALMALMRGGLAAVLLTGLSPWLIRKRPTSRSKASKLPQQPENKTEEKAQE